ncbi:calmodulin-lysine N-methyltransferase [Drosophila persimilis]|uniref:calmodulin-lysine N-methyltransferase n=1 Tax=Drosophila persimilis TaxID=7234 RepID=UPI000F07DF82|nr:calmodulin-lysine N-methyltransferase [Drosophila persimilis]XP_026843475.1 calmodulin-lysine N-methyltransferase [Drosophila persimilis]
MSAILVQKLSAETQINSQTQQQPSRKTEQSPEVEVGHLATISLLLQYDIDNTLNAFKEHRRMTMDGRGMGMGTGGPGALAVNNNQDTDVNLNRTAAGAAVGPMAELELEGLAKGCPPAGAGQGFMPPTPPATPNLQNTAQKRWKILAKVLRKDSEETVSSSSDEFSEEQTASVRRFKSFDLLQQDSFEDHVSLKCLGKTENWYKYRMQLDNDVEYSVNIHHMERQLTASDLMGFNNTGNICVWPSEEALTALVLSEVAAYRGKWILELGGGFTSLAGLMLAKYAKPYAVHLTDGNEVSVDNVRKTACLNELSCYTKCSVLKWQERSARAQAEQEKFDFILCADCLFFDEARSALVDTIWYYLAPRGVALIMAPRRGRTLSMFQDECMARGFAVELATRYNETIWQRHLQLKADSALYDEDLHYPLLLRLCKTHS